MKIEDVILFERIATLGSISAGGHALGLSATVSSDRLKRLEADLGCKLLHRTTRSLSLTYEGEQFLGKARDLTDSYESALYSVGKRSIAPTGSLKVSAPALFAKKFLSKPINAFLKDYPEMRLSLKASDQVSDYVAEGIDVAIRIGRLNDSSLIARKLKENHRLLCASPDYIKSHGEPSQPSDLADHNCIIFMDEDVWRFQRAKEEFNVKVSGRIETNSAELATQAALDGHGIALRSVWDVADDLREGRLAQVLRDYEISSTFAIYAIHPPGGFVSPAAKNFVRLVKKALQKAEI